MASETPAEIIDAARRELFGLCDGTRKWRMSVPVQVNTDSDTVLGAAIDLAAQQTAALATAQARIAELEKENAPLRQLYDATVRLAEVRPGDEQLDMVPVPHVREFWAVYDAARALVAEGETE